MSRTYVTLSGDWTSNIPDERFLRAGEICEESRFLISQPVLSNVSPDRTYECNGKTYHNEYRSLNISYGDLSGIVFDDLSGGFGIKSMAWELSDHYSLVDHVHHYSTVSVLPSLTPTAYQVKNGDVSALGVFSVNARKKALYMNRIRMYESPKPYIGQLKFLALPRPPTLPNSDLFYDSNRFGGWVYPDGRELDQARFAEAYQFFGDSYGTASEGRFRIPNITEFIKPCETASDANLADIVPSHDVLPAHIHNISNIQLDGKIKTQLQIVCTNNFEAPPDEDHSGQHAGEDAFVGMHTFSVAFDCDDLSCDQNDRSSAGDDSETYPSHTIVPVVMYVGGVK